MEWPHRHPPVGASRGSPSWPLGADGRRAADSRLYRTGSGIFRDGADRKSLPRTSRIERPVSMVGNDQQISSYRNSCWKSRADYSQGRRVGLRAYPIWRICSAAPERIGSTVADLLPCNWSQVFDQSLAAWPSHGRADLNPDSDHADLGIVPLEVPFTNHPSMTHSEDPSRSLRCLGRCSAAVGRSPTRSTARHRY